MKFKAGDFVRMDYPSEMEGTITEIVREYRNCVGTTTQVLRVAWSPFVSEELDQDLDLIKRVEP